jgi:hypothetical protein
VRVPNDSSYGGHKLKIVGKSRLSGDVKVKVKGHFKVKGEVQPQRNVSLRLKRSMVKMSKVNEGHKGQGSLQSKMIISRISSQKMLKVNTAEHVSGHQSCLLRKI